MLPESARPLTLMARSSARVAAARGTEGAQVEARPIGQAGSPGELGAGYVLDGGAWRFYVGAFEPHGDGLDPGVMPTALLQRETVLGMECTPVASLPAPVMYSRAGETSFVGPPAKGAFEVSEYQYYEFQAIDRPLGEADREELQALSSRARVTATSFTNYYNYGDFKGDPRKLVERWFDLHLYLANWGTRRLMIRLPKRFLDPSRLDVFLRKVECVQAWESGESLIVDIHYYDEESAYAGWEEGEGWLGALAPLRTDLLAGDLRLFYLLWLTAAQAGDLSDDEKEPLPGIGPLNGALDAFADFFHIDSDLVRASAERPANADGGGMSDKAVHEAIAAIPEAEKTVLLQRLVDGDPRVATEVRSKVREAVAPAAGERRERRRTVADLRARAATIRKERETAAAERREAERRRQAEREQKARRLRLSALAARGAASVWREVETEIERRNAAGYERAMRLLRDLRALAEEDGSAKDFSERVRSLRDRHERKRRFIERLAGLKVS